MEAVFGIIYGTLFYTGNNWRKATEKLMIIALRMVVALATHQSIYDRKFRKRCRVTDPWFSTLYTNKIITLIYVAAMVTGGPVSYTHLDVYKRQL